MPRLHLYVGVDGGQSSTAAVVADASGRILGRGKGGPCNHASHARGEERLRSAVADSVGAALTEAGVARKAPLRAACLGMSGGPHDKRRILAEMLDSDALVVVTDAEAALEGAAPGRPATVVIAGTGAIALARGSNGAVARCGGWGYIFGDEGGAFDIVRQALRASLAGEEGWGPPTALQAMFLKATGASSLNDVLHRLYEPDWPRRRVAALAPAVDRAGDEGDEGARRILEESGQLLARLASRAASRVGPGSLQTYPIGGVFCSRLLSAAFERECVAAGHNIARPMYDGAIGALLLAYRAAGLELPAGGVR